ncbi:MAG TPA: plasmid pRiA4b ORF-3 family protein [Candidatus Methanoperedens sp.]
MAKTKQPVDIHVYQMKLTLEDIKPPIWRRIQVTSATSLYRLHKILQVVMGWDDYHLHEFIINDMHYGEPSPDYMFKMKNDKTVKVGQAVSEEGAKFTYIYDFGDSWNHKILVEKILPIEPDKKYPICLKGKRACPPEDCGGVGGYYEFLEAIQNPNNPEHEDMLEWVGGSFDPEAFDLDKINRRLMEIR